MECDINGMREGTSQKLSPEFSSGPGGEFPKSQSRGSHGRAPQSTSGVFISLDKLKTTPVPLQNAAISSASPGKVWFLVLLQRRPPWVKRYGCWLELWAHHPRHSSQVQMRRHNSGLCPEHSKLMKSAPCPQLLHPPFPSLHHPNWFDLIQGCNLGIYLTC